MQDFKDREPFAIPPGSEQYTGSDDTVTPGRAEALNAGAQAYADGQTSFDNPHTPAPPGNPLLARLWRQGWQAAKRKDRGR